MKEDNTLFWANHPLVNQLATVENSDWGNVQWALLLRQYDRSIVGIDHRGNLIRMVDDAGNPVPYEEDSRED